MSHWQNRGPERVVMKKRFSEEQIVAILQEGQAGQKTVEQLCRGHGISQPTYYVWKRKYGSMSEPDVKRLKELEKENARLKRLLAERDVEIDVMQEFIEKKSPG
jgi:putative transposase